MSESPFDFGKDIEQIWQSAEWKAADALERQRREARAQKAQAEREEAERIASRNKLMSEWNGLDMRKLAAAQTALRSIPIETARFLVARRVPYDIQGKFVVNDSWRRRRLFMWGHHTREPIMVERSYRYSEYTTSSSTGSYSVKGWGLSTEGVEYDYGGQDDQLTARPATPKYAVSQFAAANLANPPSMLARQAVTAVQLGEEEFDAFLNVEYETAKAFYQDFATKLVAPQLPKG
jgi:hypothetical protein